MLMEINALTERISLVLEKVEQDECLCQIFSDKFANELLLNVISSPCKNLEFELLSISTLRKIAEIYVKSVVSKSFACTKISTFMQLFCLDDVWCKTLSYFKRKEDKFLLNGIAKFLAVTMYSFPPELFKLRLILLLKDLYPNATKEFCSYDLELLTCLVNFDPSISVDNNISTCKNTINCKILPPEDIFTMLCLELSHEWNTLLDTFLRTENQNICIFLNLWKNLCGRNLKEDFLPVFVNEELAVEFLSLSLKMPSESFRMYVDIISQIFSSYLKGSLLKHLEEKKFEEAVINALSAEFFLSLSSRVEISSFCTSVCRNRNLLNEESIKFDVSRKKVIFIILNLFAEFRNILLLCEALQKTFDFFAKHVRNWKPQSTYLWINDTFIEEDDLLFGMMLASVKIYCNLKNLAIRPESSNQAVDNLMEELDPHKIFIKFIQQIGNDHNELLSFLLSDETCCLQYLMQYLKLLLTEWEAFIEAHKILQNKENLSPFVSTENFSKHFIMSDSVENSPEQFCTSGSNKLVSYSSSSSSDEEFSGVVESDATKNLIGLKELAFVTLSVLIKLKVAIQKLVDMNEFPYNISPLINLLKSCEKEYNSLR